MKTNFQFIYFCLPTNWFFKIICCKAISYNKGYFCSSTTIYAAQKTLCFLPMHNRNQINTTTTVDGLSGQQSAHFITVPPLINTVIVMKTVLIVINELMGVFK
jgi:ABC-type polysaccharide transport system permease subunit